MSRPADPSRPPWQRPAPRERALAALGHAALWVSFISALLTAQSGAVGILLVAGPVIPWLIWRLNRTRHDWLAVQALQATVFHMISVIAIIVRLGLGAFLVAYASVGIVFTLVGLDFKYFLIGSLAEKVHSVQARRAGRIREQPREDNPQDPGAPGARGG